MMASEKVMTAISRIGIGLADAFRGLFETEEAAPPVGAQQTYGGVQPGVPTAIAPAPAAGGIMGIALIGAILYFVTKRKRK